MSFETLAIATTIVSTGMCALAFLLDRPSRKPSSDRTITITIQDDTGTRTRTVTRSNRSLDEVMRLLERLIAQPS